MVLILVLGKQPCRHTGALFCTPLASTAQMLCRAFSMMTEALAD